MVGNYTDNLVILYLFGILFIRWHEMDDHACRVFFPKRFVGELLGNNDFIGGIEFSFSTDRTDDLIGEEGRGNTLVFDDERQFLLVLVDDRDFCIARKRSCYKAVHACYGLFIQITDVIQFPIDVGCGILRTAGQADATLVIRQICLCGYNINKIIRQTETGDAYCQTDSGYKAVSFVF